MTPDRWFHLRHPEPIPDVMFESFRAQCRLWQAHVLAMIEGWNALSPGRCGIAVPTYEFAPPALEAGGTVATLAVGGAVTPAARKVLEADFPSLLHADFPVWFRLDLELGRRDTLGWFPETHWHPALPPEAAAALRAAPPFRR